MKSYPGRHVVFALVMVNHSYISAVLQYKEIKSIQIAFILGAAVNEDLVPLWLDPFCHFAFRCYFYFLSVCIYVLIIISAFLYYYYYYLII